MKGLFLLLIIATAGCSTKLTAPAKYHTAIPTDCKIGVAPAHVMADGVIKTDPKLDYVLKSEICSRASLQSKKMTFNVVEAYCGPEKNGGFFPDHSQSIIEINFELNGKGSPSFKETRKQKIKNQIYATTCNEILWPLIPKIVDRVEQSL